MATLLSNCQQLWQLSAIFGFGLFAKPWIQMGNS
jgi:hypothetical protein